jgi:hypothetical protein
MTQKSSNHATTGFLVVALFFALVVSVYSQNDHASHHAKVPQTAKDHYDLAKKYENQFAELRGEIAMHREMLAEFNKGVAKNPKAGENPYSKNMRLHCDKYIKAAEALASEAADSAKFHTLRGKELEGK